MKPANQTIVPSTTFANPFEAAAQFLERAAQASAGGPDPQVLYMLAMSYKRQGKLAEARTALRKIQPPDANTLLQLSLLSLAEENLEQAETDLLRAWSMDPKNYAVGYNLLLTQLTLGKLQQAQELVAPVIELNEARKPSVSAEGGTNSNTNASSGSGPGSSSAQRFLYTLGLLLRGSQARSGQQEEQWIQELGQITDAEEGRLLTLLRKLGQLDAMLSLLRVLSESRPRSERAREAYQEVTLVMGKHLVDRCLWTDAERTLRPLLREQRHLSRAQESALLNMLGCCAAMTQDFDTAHRQFSAAIKQTPNDPRLHQNLALICEFRGDLEGLHQADTHWNRFFDLLDQKLPDPPREVVREYPNALAYEALLRLAGRYSEKERWTNALGYMQRAAQLRPNEADTLERLFHLYNQAKRSGDARHTLDRLRRLRPNEPQYELYELDLVEPKNLNDIERLLTEIDRIRKRYPNDARVEDRALGMVRNVIPLMEQLCDQYTEHMAKVIDQVRSLPNYQINWTAVRDAMRDLLKEFQKLRRVTNKCLPLVTQEDHKRVVREMSEVIDKKIEVCRSMGA